MVIATNYVWSIAKAETAIAMFIDLHLTATQRETPFTLLDLRYPIAIADGVTTSHRAFRLQGKDEIQIYTVTSSKSGA